MWSSPWAPRRSPSRLRRAWPPRLCRPLLDRARTRVSDAVVRPIPVIPGIGRTALGIAAAQCRPGPAWPTGPQGPEAVLRPGRRLDLWPGAPGADQVIRGQTRPPRPGPRPRCGPSGRARRGLEGSPGPSPPALPRRAGTAVGPTVALPAPVAEGQDLALRGAWIRVDSLVRTDPRRSHTPRPALRTDGPPPEEAGVGGRPGTPSGSTPASLASLEPPIRAAGPAVGWSTGPPGRAGRPTGVDRDRVRAGAEVLAHVIAVDPPRDLHQSPGGGGSRPLWWTIPRVGIRYGCRELQPWGPGPQPRPGIGERSASPGLGTRRLAGWHLTLVFLAGPGVSVPRVSSSEVEGARPELGPAWPCGQTARSPLSAAPGPVAESHPAAVDLDHTGPGPPVSARSHPHPRTEPRDPDRVGPSSVGVRTGRGGRPVAGPRSSPVGASPGAFGAGDRQSTFR